MDIEKLIERLRTESLYKDKATLEIMDLCMDAATALATLQAENEKLRAELDEKEKYYGEAWTLRQLFLEARGSALTNYWNIFPGKYCDNTGLPCSIESTMKGLFPCRNWTRLPLACRDLPLR